VALLGYFPFASKASFTWGLYVFSSNKNVLWDWQRAMGCV